MFEYRSPHKPRQGYQGGFFFAVSSSAELRMGDIKVRLYPQDPPLLIAAHTGNAAVVEDLLSDSEPNCFNRDRASPLLAACANGHTNIARLLLENWAEMDTPDRRGRTPLIAASFNGHIEIVNLLLSKGADPLATDEQGTTALHAAVLRGFVDIANALLQEEPELRDFPNKVHILSSIRKCILFRSVHLCIFFFFLNGI
jgi:ankyrin repeat protein